jgi:hypothetical protein
MSAELTRGNVVICNAAGRALRKKPASVRVCDVLWCYGNFNTGDSVYISFCGADGGQSVIATGTVACAKSELDIKIGPPRADSWLVGPNAKDDLSVVIPAEQVQLLWPPHEVQT